MFSNTVLRILVAIVPGIVAFQAFDFEFISVSVEHYNDPDVLSIDMRMTRKEPGVYALNTNLKLKCSADNTNMVEVKLYRSKNGANNYEKTPWGFPKMHLYDFMTNVYKTYVMHEMQNCSNLPQFEDNYVGPFPSGEYYIKNYLFNKKSLPNYVPDGYYKLALSFQDACYNTTVFIILQITSDQYLG